jgi:hypothetical protein
VTIQGALVKKSGDQTTANYSTPTPVAWDSEIYDLTGWHDNVTANTKLIVPLAVTGKYGILYASIIMENLTANTSSEIAFLKGGSADFRGVAGMMSRASHTGQLSGGHWITAHSHPLLLTTGDQFEVRLTNTDTSVTVKAHSTFGIHVLGAYSTQMVLVKKAVDQTSANYSTPSAVVWDGTDVYDTNAIHDPSSNNTKLIIPSALNGKYVIVSANGLMQLVADASVASIAITKNNSFTYDGFVGQSGVNGGASTVAYMDCRTPPIQVATGDEFEMVAYCDDTSITFSAFSTFGLRVVDF